MEASEIEVAIDELETRLERLRALYEQYFLGIERVEPSVARKDVDRRIYLLRRAQIRNTARRFKLQTIIQRYNTFQQYWQRICREIENGTYKRHLLRAERSGLREPLTIAARKRFGRQARPSEAPAAEAEPSAAEKAERAAAEVEQTVSAALFSDDAIADAMNALGGVFDSPEAADPGAPQAKPKAGIQPGPAGTARPEAAPAKPAHLKPLELELEFLEPGGDRPAPRPAAPPPPRRSAEAGGTAANRPPPPPKRDVPRAPAAAPAPPPPRPPASSAKAAPPALSKQPQPPARPAPAAAPKAPAPAGPRPPPPSTTAAAQPPPSPAAAAVRPAPAQAPAPDRTEAPAPARAPARAAAPGPARTEAPAPARAPAPTSPRSPAPAKSAAPARAAARPDAPEDRVRSVHERFVAARQQTRESPNVSVASLERSMREAEARLRQKHGNRRIDFDVVIKNGKAVLKPIVR